MGLPFFYIADLNKSMITLDEDTSKHMIGVLRMQKGEEVLLTNGQGKKGLARIVDDNRKKCVVNIMSLEEERRSSEVITVAISLIKNTSRFEWFLEKATEIGVSEIIPLTCERTEKEKFRFDRLHNILVSAMLQSQQAWMPRLQQPQPFSDIVLHAAHTHKYIAHCIPGEKIQLAPSITGQQSSIILIGPEGDFTEEEIRMALQHKYQPVSLGHTRLRTETAGIVAATLLCICPQTP